MPSADGVGLGRARSTGAAEAAEEALEPQAPIGAGEAESPGEEAVAVRGTAPSRTQAGALGGSMLEAQLREHLEAPPLAGSSFDPDRMPEVGRGRAGDTSATRTLQDALNEWRDRLGKAALKADGGFGATTEANLAHYQKAVGLPPTGVADRETWRALAGTLRPRGPVTEPARPGGKGASFDPAAMPSVAQGAKDSAAAATLQRSLNGWRATRNLPALEADGDFGRATKDALVTFQRLNGLEPTGRADAATWSRLAAIESRGVAADRGPVDVKVPWISQYDGSGRVERPGDKACFRASAAMVKEFLASTGTSATLNAVYDKIDIGKRETASGDVIASRASAAAGRAYVDRALDAGLPAVVGISYKAGSDYNRNPVTDHFVVITGRGRDEAGRAFYTFKDPSTTKADRAEGRFYVDAEGKLDKAGKGAGLLADQHFEVSEVRTWKELP